MVTACDDANQMRYDEADESDNAGGGHCDGGGQRRRDKHQVSKVAYRQSDDGGLKFAACEYVQMASDECRRQAEH